MIKKVRVIIVLIVVSILSGCQLSEYTVQTDATDATVGQNDLAEDFSEDFIQSDIQPTQALEGKDAVLGKYWLSYCVDGAGNIVLDHDTFIANYDIQIEDNFSLQNNMRVYREEGVYPYYYGEWQFENDQVTMSNEYDTRTFVFDGNNLKCTIPFSEQEAYLLSGSTHLISNPEDTYLVYEKTPNDDFPYDYMEADPIDFNGTWGFASASSILDYSTNYETLNMFDNDFSTAWVEGVSGNGEGEIIFIGIIDENYRVSGISLINGYTKSEDLYYKNARLKTATVMITTASDVYMEEVALKDNILDYQNIDFGQIYEDVKSVEIIIGESYEGSKYEDLCISELRLIN